MLWSTRFNCTSGSAEGKVSRLKISILPSYTPNRITFTVKSIWSNCELGLRRILEPCAKTLKKQSANKKGYAAGFHTVFNIITLRLLKNSSTFNGLYGSVSTSAQQLSCVPAVSLCLRNNFHAYLHSGRNKKGRFSLSFA